jgi:NADPH-dependent 2,4-dienoyl-CoA reductase/sulfur reductase-like enzyme
MNSEPLVVLGGGPAGLAAAVAAHDAGCGRILLMERDRELGGILNQCVHDGFGNFIFGAGLTGPEYAGRFIGEVRRRPGIEVLTETTALSLKKDRSLVAVNQGGLLRLQPPAVVLALGCRERSRFQAMLPGYRPAGVYTAGTAQRLINMEGLMPGERIVILGSGDVGLIMARRLTLEGARVLGVFEIQPRPGGLTRNVVQCLDDFAIPLYLSHTITFIHGKKRVEGVSVAPVDAAGAPLAEKERFIPCDTLILSVGLIPENELSREAGVAIDPATRGPAVDQDMATSVPGIFAGGNVVQVHDLVDYVTISARRAGAGAARFIRGESGGRQVRLVVGEKVASVVPQLITLPVTGPVDLYVRVQREVRAGVLKVRCAARVLRVKKQRAMRPPEMIRLALDVSLLEDLAGGEEIIVAVEGGD